VNDLPSRLAGSPRMRRVAGALVVLLATAGVLLGRSGAQNRAQSPSTFARQIAALSEKGGYFDTDNLISNEGSYLQVLPDLRRRHVSGGAYLGVGPDQNFTYIAQVRPSIAFIIDVRRDNLLLHLLFKALFGLARTRVEYLSLLTGRPVPADMDSWRTAPVSRIADYVEKTPFDPGTIAALRTRVDDAIANIGVPLSKDDFETIDRFHRRFIADALSMRFQSLGRPPQMYYPTYRQMLVDTDAEGREGNYLASEDTFQFVKGLEAKDLVIPVVGDVSGPSAMGAIAKLLESRGERVSVFYASNVEFYLFGEGSFGRFVENLGRLPHDSSSVLIRSVFRYFGRSMPRPGDGSVSQVEPIETLVSETAAGRIQRYGDLVSR
jgi:hypothetical protein